MNNYNYAAILFAFFGLTSLMGAQEILRVEEAVQIALENNYQIKIASNELQIDGISVSPANAGMLPQVKLNLTDNNSIQNLTQTRSDGNVVERDNAKNNSLNYGVAMDWTLFDGLRMFADYEQLKETHKLGEAQLKQVILNKVGEVMITYFDLVQQKQQLMALDSTIIISKQRVDLAYNRFTIGKASKLEVLNAQVDLNTDETLMQRQKELYVNTKVKLNQYLARDLKIDFEVVTEIFVDQGLVLPELETLVEKENPAIQVELINKRISELELKQTKALRYPTIFASTGYNFGRSESSLGFTTSSNSRGWNYGFGASLNVFDGFNQNRNEKIAKIQIENAEVAIAQRKQELMSVVNTTYQTYLTNISLIELEGKNEAIAQENMEITVEKYRIGIIPTIEFRTAQLNYINAKVRHSNAKFQAKLSEIILKQLAGNLVL
ncbi:TolC family protein [Arenibacter sp. M-2]|uniref:TolC family protein n=1 Tax=unclassified Arenibacter TaxID=2615047 RepID=UPI000D76283F|nr:MULTISPECIES: TolC family protein [unclassified Arenibacter]MDL5510888.1 TolC family protein [Arenibacter sp. M-2]PXX31689.1 outer membrane protein TolC [Arenibacter sp. ARW7G5Y1]|tara:strand:- start:5938 stop:7248 length:1311 start_codon:yes stop_codon:yes gene_type:complete